MRNMLPHCCFDSFFAFSNFFQLMKSLTYCRLHEHHLLHNSTLYRRQGRSYSWCILSQNAQTWAEVFFTSSGMWELGFPFPLWQPFIYCRNINNFLWLTQTILLLWSCTSWFIHCCQFMGTWSSFRTVLQVKGLLKKGSTSISVSSQFSPVVTQSYRDPMRSSTVPECFWSPISSGNWVNPLQNILKGIFSGSFVALSISCVSFISAKILLIWFLFQVEGSNLFCLCLLP